MAHTVTQFRSPRGCLSYVVSDNASKKALLIDPSEEVATEAYLGYLKDNGLTLEYLVETHTHADHISSAPSIKKETGATVVHHEQSESSRKDRGVTEEDIELGETTVRVLQTPGHTNDSITLVVGDDAFTGDTLLIGGTGRTDFQAGSSEFLYESIWDKLVPLGDHVTVHPGHDYQDRTHSTIGGEKRQNPRLQLSKEEFIAALDAHHPPTPELFEEAIQKNSE